MLEDVNRLWWLSIPIAYACLSWYMFQLIYQDRGHILAPPLSHRVLAGQAFAGFAGSFAFLWKAITHMRPERPSTFLGLADGVLVLLLVIATTIQATYVAFLDRQCAKYPLPLLYDRIGDSSTIWWVSGGEICIYSLNMWWLGIVMIIIYSFSGYFAFRYGPAERWPLLFRGGRRVLNGFISFPTMIMTVPLYIVYVPFALAFEFLLPGRVKIRIIRMARTIPRASKILCNYNLEIQNLIPARFKRSKQTEEISLTNINTASETPRVQGLPYDILFLITTHLHHIDLISLSQSSKALRTAFFPESISGPANLHVRPTICSRTSAASGSSCWGCGIRVCAPGSTSDADSAADTAAHAEEEPCVRSTACPDTSHHAHYVNCDPCCSKCFVKHFRWSEAVTGGRMCACVDSRKTFRKTYRAVRKAAEGSDDGRVAPEGAVRAVAAAAANVARNPAGNQQQQQQQHPQQRRTAQQVATQRAVDIVMQQPLRQICRSCSLLNDYEILKLRERHDMDLCAQKTAEKTQCGECSADLPRDGARWWYCKTCRKECPDDQAHIAGRKKRKITSAV